MTQNQYFFLNCDILLKTIVDKNVINIYDNIKS